MIMTAATSLLAAPASQLSHGARAVVSQFALISDLRPGFCGEPCQAVLTFSNHQTSFDQEVVLNVIVIASVSEPLFAAP